MPYGLWILSPLLRLFLDSVGNDALSSGSLNIALEVGKHLLNLFLVHDTIQILIYITL